MSVTDFLLNVALLMISLVVPVATTLVVNYLKAKVGNENLKKYLALTETAVKAAEITYPGTKQGAIKKAEVEVYLAQKIGHNVTEQDIDKLIQSAVYEINKTAKPLIYSTNPLNTDSSVIPVVGNTTFVSASGSTPASTKLNTPSW